MFNRKLMERVDTLSGSVSHLSDKQRNDYWELKNDLRLLVEALGMTKEEKHVVRYVRKGGPEKDALE